MVVSAEASRDLNDKPLKWHWVVLRGDAEAIKIQPRNKARLGGRTERAVPPAPADQTGQALESNRVDIGCFVHNGAYFSAPAFITFFSLDNEDRRVRCRRQDPLGHLHGADDKGNYVDPMLDLPKSWRDEYHYDANGHSPAGRATGAACEDFTPTVS